MKQLNILLAVLLASCAWGQTKPESDSVPASVIRAERALMTCDDRPHLPDVNWPNNPWHCTFAFVDTTATSWVCPEGYVLRPGAIDNQRWCDREHTTNTTKEKQGGRMFETIDYLHKALRIQSPWVFILTVAGTFGVVAFVGSGFVAWVVERGYQNTLVAQSNPKSQAVVSNPMKESK